MKVKIKKDFEIEITKEDLEDYEKVRVSGATNMLDIKTVSSLSDNLSEEKVKAIIDNYEKLIEEYPDVRGA